MKPESEFTIKMAADFCSLCIVLILAPVLELQTRVAWIGQRIESFYILKLENAQFSALPRATLIKGWKTIKQKCIFVNFVNIISTEDVLFEALVGYLDAEPAVWHQRLCDISVCEIRV